MKSYGKNNNKKVIVIILIVLFVLIGLAASVLAMVLTGNIALNNEQKLAKGLKDTITKISEMYPEEENNFIQDYNKMYITPFEQETVITGSINQLDIGEMEENEEAKQMLTAIKEFVAGTKITNTIQADLNNRIIKENLKLGIEGAVEEISLDLEYNNNIIGFRSKELNEKYLTISKSDIEANEQYEDLIEIFEMIENVSKKTNFEALTFTDEEKLYFQENYTNIFRNYLTEETIIQTEGTITVDGKMKECSVVTLSFDKQKIQAIVGEILQKFESDITGKSIIVNKFKVLSEEFTEEDLLDIVAEIRDGVVNLKKDERIALTVYGTNFKTYAIELEIYENEQATKISLVLGKDIINLDVSDAVTKILTGTIVSNQVNVIIPDEEETMTLNLKKQGNITEFIVNGKGEEYNNSVIFTHEQFTKTELETKERYSIRYSLNAEDGGGDFTINVDSNFKYIDSIATTTFTNENSLNTISGNTTDLQNYINTVKTNGMDVLQKAQEKSGFIKQVLDIMQLNQNIGDETINVTTMPTSQTFNSQFDIYNGVQKGSVIKSLLEKVGTNNQNSTHIVTVVIVGPDNSIMLNTSNSVEMVIAMNDIVNSGEYIVAMAQYDEEGYLKTIAIKKNF